MSEKDERMEEVLADLEAMRDRIRDLGSSGPDLREARKMEALGRMARGVAHGMNDVLAVILSLGSVLENEVASDDPKRQDIHEIVAAARRGRTLIQNLVGFVGRRNLVKELLSLNETVAGIVEVLGHSSPKGITFRTALDESLPIIECEPVSIGRMVMNLCQNAVDAVGKHGTVTISTRTVDGDPPGIELELADDGGGMTDEIRRRVFEPFFTTKSVATNSGLGLSMVYGTINDHGGTISIASTVGEGTVVTVRLPAVEAPVVQRVATTTAPPSGTTTILLVDDEQMVRRAGRRVLEMGGYQVVEAENGGVALERLEQESDIVLVLLDVAMPVMDGAECLERIRAARPELPVLICSGYDSGPNGEELADKGADGFVRKPFEPSELFAAIARALHG